MINSKDFLVALDKTLERVLTSKPDSPIGADETFDAYGLDSLDQMNMLLEIEEEINVTIGDVDLKLVDTPAKLHEHLVNVLKA